LDWNELNDFLRGRRTPEAGVRASDTQKKRLDREGGRGGEEGGKGLLPMAALLSHVIKGSSLVEGLTHE